MTRKRYQVRAEYRGYVDLGAACFAVPLVDINPKSTVYNKIVFRSRIGDEFTIGEKYDVLCEIYSESDGSPRQYEVIAVI